MSENRGGGAMPFLVFLVVGLVVAVVVVGIFTYTGHNGNLANVPSHLSLSVTPRHS